MFKVGDWVTHGKELHQILEVEKGYVKASNLGELSNCWINESKFNLWKPKEGEWCWFWDDDFLSDNSTPILGKFEAKTKHGYRQHANYCFYQHCEPFIGNLPSFI